MKILALLIYNKNDIYDQMMEVQRMYLHNNECVESYFVTFNENQMEEVVISNDVIYIKGKESHINILKKTINAITFLVKNEKKEYDFVVRGNMSTFIHLSNLCKFLNEIQKENVYLGGTLETLLWPLQPYEICNQKQHQRNDYYKLKYFQGTSIILSMDVCHQLIDKDIDYDMVDDVKLGLLIREQLPAVYEKSFSLPKPNLKYSNFENEVVFIRNSTFGNRMLDVHKMRYFVSLFNNVKYSDFNKIIHITYKNTDSLQNIRDQWYDLNPEYHVELYDDNRCINFLQSHFGEKYSKIFEYIQDGAIKCDFFRLCALYICGGVYVDADIKPIISLKDFLDDDVELATCISYNWRKHLTRFNYNPHFIVSKKYNKHIFETIKKYEYAFDSKKPYSYWEWSICTMFDLPLNDDIDSSDFPFKIFKEDKKYQFLIEKVLKDNYVYDYKNIKNENGEMKIMSGEQFFCEYDGQAVLFNFLNKHLL